MWFCPWLGGKPIDLLLHKKDIHIRRNKNSCKIFVRAEKMIYKWIYYQKNKTRRKNAQNKLVLC